MCYYCTGFNFNTRGCHECAICYMERSKVRESKIKIDRWKVDKGDSYGRRRWGSREWLCSPSYIIICLYSILSKTQLCIFFAFCTMYIHITPPLFACFSLQQVLNRYWMIAIGSISTIKLLITIIICTFKMMCINKEWQQDIKKRDDRCSACIYVEY